jgi:twitching motility protein PilT
MTEEQAERFASAGDLDFCLTVGTDRYRANACQTRLGPSIAFRLIQDRVPTLAELKLPPEVQKLTTYSQGLVLVTGPLGAGKTTSIMALVDLINRTRHDHIITVEDPIEYLLPPVRCQVSQRELGAHTRTFETALRAALREDPDVIVIGDLRDYETARLAIAAAETGHLVFASMPAMNAMKTLDRLLDMFPASEQAVVRTTVSESLRGVLCQRLVPGAKGELVVAVELLINSVAIANIIRDGKTSNLKSAMQTGKAQGMRTLAMSLEELVKRGEVSAATAEAVLAS